MSWTSRSGPSLCGCLALACVLVGCAASLDSFDEEIRDRSMDPADRLALIHVADAPPASAGEAAEPLLIDEESSLSDCLLFAAMSSPVLEASRARWRAALERSTQATALPDPRVTYGYFISEVETRVGPQRHRIGASQSFPWFGTLEARGETADRGARAAFERHQAETLAVFHRVRAAFYELFYLRRSIAVTRENVELLRQFERTARARYRVAAASHPDVIRAQVELARLSDRLSQLEQMRPARLAALNAALGRAPAAPAPWPSEIASRRVDAPFETLEEWLAASNPDLRALAEEIEKERAGAELARKQFGPDFTLGFEYIVTGEAVDPTLPESGDDAALATISLSVPLWRDKYEAAVREALERRLAAAETRRAREHDLGAALREAMYEHEDAARRLALYEQTLIPKARESLRASLSAFQAAEASFFDLLETERSLLEFQMAAERARADLAISLSRLEMLVGRPLPRRPLASTNEDQRPATEGDES